MSAWGLSWGPAWNGSWGPYPPIPVTIQQTLYARAPHYRQPDFPALFPFWGPGAPGELYVSNFSGVSVPALAGMTVALVVDLSTRLGPNTRLARVNLSLLCANGGDLRPGTRLNGAAAIFNTPTAPRGQAIRQLLVNLVSGAQYVAWITVGTATGEGYTFVAPFTAA